MPVKQENASIAISVEVKYISHGGGIGTLDVTPYQTLRDEVRRLTQVVKDKKLERKEAVFSSIESKLESIAVNVQKLKDQKPVCTGNEAEKFMKDLREGEKYVRNCMSKSEKFCFCIETSKPRFLADELQRFDSCLESFNGIVVRALQAEARNSRNKTQFETRNNTVQNPEEINKKPEEMMQSKHPKRSTPDPVLSSANDQGLPSTSGKDVSWTRALPAAPAPVISGDSNKYHEVLTKSNLMPSNPSENNDSAVNRTAYSDNLTQRKDVQPRNLTHSSISSNTSRDVQPNYLTPFKHFAQQMKEIQGKYPTPAVANSITASASPVLQPHGLTHTSISPNAARDEQPHNLTHSSISSNTSRDVQLNYLTPFKHFAEQMKGIQGKYPPHAVTNSITASASPAPFNPSDRVAGFSTATETNKGKDPASAMAIKASSWAVPSDRVNGLNPSRESHKEKEFPSAAAVRGSSATALDQEFCRDSPVRGFEDHKNKRAAGSSDVGSRFQFVDSS